MKCKKLLLMCLSILMVLGMVGGFTLTAKAETNEVKSVEFYTNKIGRQFVEVKWEKASKVTGYEIQLATDKNFTKNKKVVKIVKKSQTSTLIKNLKANQKYYMRGRTYKDANSYSDWSEVATIKLLKKKSNNKVNRNYEYTIGKSKKVTITAYTGNEAKVIIPTKLSGKKVTKIGDEAFANCESVKSVKIPKGVTSIGYSAFYGCKNLSSISLPKGITKIESSILADTKYINNKKNWKNKALYISDYLIATKGIKGKYSIKKGTKLVADRAFAESEGEEGLKSITIPSSVVSIGEYAFLYCEGLKEVTIPNTVKSIGKNTFDSCWNLKSAKLPKGMKKIPDGMFARCNSLKNIVLPKGITEIGEAAFVSCSSLKSITIPKSLKKVGQMGLAANFTSIKYEGTKKQWKAIKMDSDNLEYRNISIHCTDGVLKLKAAE